MRNPHAVRTDNELTENRVGDITAYMLAFLQEDFDTVLKEGMNTKQSLGWSGTFMKCGLAAFLLLLYDAETLRSGGERMIRIVMSYVNDFNYQKDASDNGTHNETLGFWRIFLEWKKSNVKTEDTQTKKEKIMKYTIAVCDDSEQDAQYIASIANKWAEKEALTIAIKTFPSAESFLFSYAKDKDFDMLLLDIEMQAMNGVELAKTIRQENDTIQIIFITGFPDFMAEGYEVSALHYLMKPVSCDKLSAALNRAADRLNKTEKSVIITLDGESTRLAASDIIMVEAFAHVCTFTTTDARFEIRTGIAAIEKMLSEAAEGEFVRCHRSYLIGVRYIKSISKTDVTLDSGMKIPLSRGNYQTVSQAFIHYFKGASQWD